MSLLFLQQTHTKVYTKAEAQNLFSRYFESCSVGVRYNVIDLPEGTSVRANIEGIEPEPDKLVSLLGKRVEMYTEKVRTDREGNDVIAFKFRPAKG